MNQNKQKRLIIARHGERVDFCFNERPHWTDRVVDSQGKYRPFNINLPRNLPRRANGVAGFRGDTPLTEIGYLQSKLIGRAFRDKNITFDAVYVSPSLRCIQTAIGILKGMICNDLKLNIEPGLFEWLRLSRNHQVPTWMTLEECVEAGYPVNLDYEPIYKVSDLIDNEPLNTYYTRSYVVARTAMEKTSYSSILFVAHGSSLDACTRLLAGGKPRNVNDFYDILQRTPYLSTIQLNECNRNYEIAGSPLPSLTHSVNYEYDDSLLRR